MLHVREEKTMRFLFVVERLIVSFDDTDSSTDNPDTQPTSLRLYRVTGDLFLAAIDHENNEVATPLKQ